MNHIFHVHTWRCGHAEDVSDEEYIKKAIELGAERITFTDHAPFPDDLFSGRMKIAQLPEYISTLLSLKDKYSNNIDVEIGLEVEYLPSYKSYIADLRQNKDIDILLLGQHHYEVSPGIWSFQKRSPDEWKGLIDAIIQGIQTDLFDVVAHPDRAFRSQSFWTKEMEQEASKLINSAIAHHTILEINSASMNQNNAYREEFWRLVPSECFVIIGYDAHSINDIEKYYLTN